MDLNTIWFILLGVLLTGYAILDGFDLDRFRPRILVMENDRPAGAAIEPYLAGRGYRKFYRQKINDFYVRADDPCRDLTVAGLPLCL